jgi:hypothetical protein
MLSLVWSGGWVEGGLNMVQTSTNQDPEMAEDVSKVLVASFIHASWQINKIYNTAKQLAIAAVPVKKNFELTVAVSSQGPSHQIRCAWKLCQRIGLSEKTRCWTS